MSAWRAISTNPLILAALLLLAVEYGGAGILATLESRYGDLLLRLNAQQQEPDPDIVIVDIDEHSLDRMAPLAGRYPWPRAVFAELLEGIERQQPAAVAFDILFTDPDVNAPEGDAWLAEVAGQQDNVYFPLLRLEGNDANGLPLAQYGAALGIGRGPQARDDARVALLLPLPELAQTGRLGAINYTEDSDGVGRRYHLYLDAYGWRIPSLPARVAADLGYALPDRPDLLLNWRGPALSYTRIPFADIYDDLGRSEPQRPRDEFTGKIVIIGSTAAGLHDLRSTAMGSLFPAVEIVATALDNLKHGDALRALPRAVPAVIALLLLGALLLAFRRQNPLRIGLGLLLITPLFAALQYGALQLRWVLPLFTPLVFGWLYYVAAALHAWLREKRERERSVQIFSRFLDPRVVQNLVAQGESALTLKSQSRQLTVLFSDIRGFTTLSEQHTAEEIVDLLNDYFSRQVKVIFKHGGTMDKFIGDAIMAFWGAPVDDSEQALHTVSAALDMCDTLEEFRRHLGPSGEHFDVGIGIHTGPAVVGFIGSDNRLDYTAIGDTVNLASRIEGQTKGVARVLVSADTRALCGDAFDFIDHGSYKVKGRSQEVRLYEPCRKAESSDEIQVTRE
ncbi:MAG: adenylate/guanylate cyclase domain-containing protein [Gammaproteobacteria bacterium HGW-Gammaproteobacteria-1]|jgi:adenylate cyclase|nr:MAG: adenylate/guanylate cyclase domain-containing protein [Gammaproteobacteria bacterium HGW-Gammaproteobacteria-1]